MAYFLFVLHKIFLLFRGGGRPFNKYCVIGNLKFHNVKFNANSISIYGSMPLIKIGKNANVSIGNNFILRTGVDNGIDGGWTRICVSDNATLTIGEMSGMTNTAILCHEEITIGNYVNIGAGCMIMDSNFHSTNWHDRLDRKLDVSQAKNKSVHIGDVVFIGARSIICKGVSIGDHSMIAAGSVVVTNIPEGEIWGGNPAKFIRKCN